MAEDKQEEVEVDVMSGGTANSIGWQFFLQRMPSRNKPFGGKALITDKESWNSIAQLVNAIKKNKGESKGGRPRKQNGQENKWACLQRQRDEEHRKLEIRKENTGKKYLSSFPSFKSLREGFDIAADGNLFRYGKLVLRIENLVQFANEWAGKFTTIPEWNDFVHHCNSRTTLGNQFVILFLKTMPAVKNDEEAVSGENTEREPSTNEQYTEERALPVSKVTNNQITNNVTIGESSRFLEQRVVALEKQAKTLKKDKAALEARVLAAEARLKALEKAWNLRHGNPGGKERANLVHLEHSEHSSVQGELEKVDESGENWEGGAVDNYECGDSPETEDSDDMEEGSEPAEAEVYDEAKGRATLANEHEKNCTALVDSPRDSPVLPSSRQGLSRLPKKSSSLDLLPVGLPSPLDLGGLSSPEPCRNESLPEQQTLLQAFGKEDFDWGSSPELNSSANTTRPSTMEAPPAKRHRRQR